MGQYSEDFILTGKNEKAVFSLKVYRGDGMVLLAMNWKKGRPPRDFVGFSIEYKEPDGDRYYALKNRLSFLNQDGTVCKVAKSSLLSPFQMFRWVHFPRNADKNGAFVYVVKPVFMNYYDELSYGEEQRVEVVLHRETYPDCLDVAFTRGFISSQAFVDRFSDGGGVAVLLPKDSKSGIDFVPTHPKAPTALSWMGFDAVEALLRLLDEAIADRTAEVRVVAFDLNLPAVVERFIQLGERLSIIIDDSAEHNEHDSAESIAFERLLSSTKGKAKRQHMGQLQHNKTIVVNGTKVKAAVCGSTNFTWRGLYVQSNNVVVVRGEEAIKPFWDAFENYWNCSTPRFGKTSSAQWNDLNLSGIDAQVSFSPHSKDNALLDAIASDVANTESSLFYSLAFLAQTTGSLKEEIVRVLEKDDVFVYGISDKRMGGLNLQKPNGNLMPVYPQAISKNMPEPFKSEPTGGGGTRMHHKFIVIDFDKPTARVYLGSYNFSGTADRKNGENLLLIKDRKVAISYMIEALRIFDHYHFRVNLAQAEEDNMRLFLTKAPRTKDEKPWWEKFYTDPKKIKDREMFCKE
ncbi:phospholipase D-like domain-containing protein [Porphyromonas gingivalis]|uniref:phospholipase D-like domain-containing protein n=1 Tax=Porphyromonas gingivalis TaxID=837 RepID=UPI000BE731CA|nr:phospholipase D-like domain-containing protein [Porphyromonas gingivalis]PDP72854.1 phospholipase [Porphyromonas gingivalis]